MVQDVIDQINLGYLKSFLSQYYYINYLDFTLVITEGGPSPFYDPSSIAITAYGTIDPRYVVTISLSRGPNPTGLGPSKEFTVAAIYNSVAEAILRVEGSWSLTFSPTFLDSYIPMVASKVMAHCPSAEEQDAMALGSGIRIIDLYSKPVPTNEEQVVLSAFEAHYLSDAGIDSCSPDW